jgi:uncharacterized protein (DUF1499 family)
MAGLRDFWVRGAAGLALLLPAYFLLAAMATKFHWVDWRIGFGLLTVAVGPILVLAALAVAAIGLALAGLAAPRRGWRLALFSLFVPAAALLLIGGALAKASRLPAIHDISTDLEDPPTFSPTVEAERALVNGGNGLEREHARVPSGRIGGAFAGRLINDAQRAAFPDIKPIPVGAPPARALAVARGAGQRLGWTIDRVDEQAGIIEARATSFWYGFTDDIVVRVTPADPGAVIDVRSVSRVGVSDLGVNAARVRAFAAEVARELSGGG